MRLTACLLLVAAISTSTAIPVDSSSGPSVARRPARDVKSDWSRFPDGAIMAIHPRHPQSDSSDDVHRRPARDLEVETMAIENRQLARKDDLITTTRDLDAGDAANPIRRPARRNQPATARRPARDVISGDDAATELHRRPARRADDGDDNSYNISRRPARRGSILSLFRLKPSDVEAEALAEDTCCHRRAA